MGALPANSAQSIEVLCVGLGPIGLRIASRILSRPDLEIVGAVDIDPEKVGKELISLLETQAPAGLRVSAEIFPRRDRVRAAIALHSTTSSLIHAAPQLEELLAAGYNVISTCEELAYPWEDVHISNRLNEGAIKAGVTVVGAGINPGFMMDLLPLTLTGACVSVDHILIKRSVNTNQRRLPLQRKAGVGMAPDLFRRLAATESIGHVGLRQSALLLGDRLGWSLERIDFRMEPVLADSHVDTALGPVEAGMGIGQRQTLSAYSHEREVIRLELEMSAVTPGGDEVWIVGNPDIHQFIEGGINGDIATEAVVTNLIRCTIEARPGLLTVADLVPLSGRAT